MRCIFDYFQKVSNDSNSRTVQYLALSTTFFAGLVLVVSLMQLTTYFYISGEKVHEGEAWKRVSTERSWVQEGKNGIRLDTARYVENKYGAGARILTMLHDDIGFPGAASYQQVREAWTYDFAYDYTRSLSESAFGVPPLEAFEWKKNYPRLIHYNQSYESVFFNTERYADLYEMASQGYGRFQTLKDSNEVDPFYMELMRVGAILSTKREPFQNATHAVPLSPTSDKILWRWGIPIVFELPPKRSLHRVGFLPLNGEPREQLEKRLTSFDRSELIELYDGISFTKEEMLKHGFHLDSLTFDPDEVSATVSSEGSGYLIIFDSWNRDWRLDIDGKSEVLGRAFVALRSVAIEAGTHQILMKFKPQYLYGCVFLSLLALVFCFFVSIPSKLTGRLWEITTKNKNMNYE